jgi:hypothetical protein
MNIIQNDYGFSLSFGLTNSTGSFLNLTGGSVLFTVADRITNAVL